MSKRAKTFSLIAVLFLALTSFSANTEEAPVADPTTTLAPIPRFARNKHVLPDRFLAKKREHRYLTPMPILGWDPDTGFNFGAMINFFDNGSKESPFFKIAPYKQEIFTWGYITTEGVFQVGGYFDQPYIFDTPWRVRSAVDFYSNPIQNYFGIGNAGDLLISPFNGQAFNKYDSYKNDLKQTIGGVTYSSYDDYKQERIAYEAFAEYDLFGGYLRPLAGFRVAHIWVKDYSGNAESGGAVQGTTHLQADCNAGLAIGCNGGFDNFLKFGLTFDTRNFEPDPERGLLAESVLELSPKIFGSKYLYGRWTTSIHGYGKIIEYKEQQLTLAARFLYSWQFGDVPFYSMNTYAFTERDRNGLGGLRTLRGFRQDRFIGPVTLLSNTELRWNFVEFNIFKQDIKLGSVGFLDAGRVFDANKDLTFSNWKLSGGGGMRLAWNLATIVVFDYGVSPEGNAFYMDLQHQF